MIQVGILLCFIPLFMWGIGDYLAAKLSRKMSPFAVNLVYSVYSFALPLGFCIVRDFPHVTGYEIVKYTFVSSLFTAGFLCMVKGFSKGATGLIAPIANAYALITFTISIIFFHAKITALQVPAILLIVGGVSLVSYQKYNKRNKKVLYSISFGLLAMFFFGIGFALLATIHAHEWYQNQLLLGTVSMITAPLLMQRYDKKTSVRELLKMARNLQGIIGGIAGAIGTIGLFAAIAAGTSVVLAATISSAAPLCTVVLAYVIDHEHLKSRQRIGTLFVVAGVVVLNAIA